MDGKTAGSGRIFQNPAAWVLLVILAANCQFLQGIPSPEATDTALPEAPTFTEMIPTPTCTETVQPTPSRTRTKKPNSTPQATTEDYCKLSGGPEAFEPSAIPDILLETDKQILSQTSVYTETDLYLMESYGGASYGTETRYHYTCHEKIPSPDILSYCRFETETVRIHVTSGEIQDTPQKSVHESLVRGKEVWIRTEGGEWSLADTLEDSEVVDAADAFKISIFFREMKEGCETGNEYPELTIICFGVNVPAFFQGVFGETVQRAECVQGEQGVLWINPQTRLPKQWSISFYAEVHYPSQAEDEMGYNKSVDMKQKYLAFNEQYKYPNP